MSRRTLRMAALLLLAALLAAGASYLSLRLFRSEAAAQALAAVRVFLDAWGWPAALVYIAVFTLLGAMGIPPAALIVPAILAWAPWPALAVSIAGGMGASVLGFWASRHWLRALVEPRIPPHVRQYESRLETHGLSTVIVLRLIFYLFPPVNWLLGLSHISLKTFTVGTLIGSLPGTVILVFTGNGVFQWLAAQPPSVLVGLGAGMAFFLGLWTRLIAKTPPMDDGGAEENKAAANGGDPVKQPNAPGITWALFVESVELYVRLAWGVLFRRGDDRPRPALRRIAVMAVFLPAFGLLQLIHWMAFWADEWLFPNYRRTPMGQPLFIVGIPRSGTTFLHRVLARDVERFTCFTLWELVLAPAIIERKLVGAAARADRLLGRPFERLLRWVAERCTGGMASVHKLALEEPEEDFLLFLPVLACYILVAVFPHDREITGLARFDEDMDPDRRRRLMAFYRAMVQRHLYAHGGHRTFLSKNVSFTPMLSSLLEAFPGCRLAICTRTPSESVPSQISAMEGPWRVFGNDPQKPGFAQRWVDLMRHYYTVQREALARLPQDRARLLQMRDLQCGLADQVRSLYEAFGFMMSDSFAAALEEEDSRAKAYRSKHSYDCTKYGLSTVEIDDLFAPLYDGGCDPRHTARNPREPLRDAP